MFFSDGLLDFIDEDDEDDEEDDDDEDGLMSDYSSVGQSIKFEPANSKGGNKNNRSNEEANSAELTSNPVLRNISMNDDMNTNQLENNSHISIQELEKNNESEGNYKY